MRFLVLAAALGLTATPVLAQQYMGPFVTYPDPTIEPFAQEGLPFGYQDLDGYCADVVATGQTGRYSRSELSFCESRFGMSTDPLEDQDDDEDGFVPPT